MNKRTSGTLTGAGSGAITGAAAGSTLGPYGAAVGGVLGGVAGGLGGYFAGSAEQEAEHQDAEQRKQLAEYNRRHMAARQQNIAQIYQMYGPYMDMVNQYTGTNYKPPSPPTSGYFG